MREILAELVAIPSVSGEEGALAGYIAGRYDPSQVTVLGDSVVVHIPGKDPTKAFILNGHIDTVPATNEWTSDPFTLRQDPEDPDKLIGLGATDMKSGVAIMLGIGDEAQQRPPPQDVWLFFSAREETDSSGSVAIANWFADKTKGRYRTVGGLILEPTDAEFVGVGHRADTVWNITAQGPGGHASREFPGEKPPIEKLASLIGALPGLRQDWVLYADALLGNPTINVTTNHAGATTNVVPTEARATFNLRITPAQARDLSGIRERLASEFGVTIEQAWEPTPTLCGEDEHIYRVVKGAMPTIPFQAFPGATDQFAFHAQDIPMLLYGPGAVDAMHLHDEWVRWSRVVKCRTMISLIMKHF